MKELLLKALAKHEAVKADAMKDFREAYEALRVLNRSAGVDAPEMHGPPSSLLREEIVAVHHSLSCLKHNLEAARVKSEAQAIDADRAMRKLYLDIRASNRSMVVTTNVDPKPEDTADARVRAEIGAAHFAIDRLRNDLSTVRAERDRYLTQLNRARQDTYEAMGQFLKQVAK